MTRRVRIGVELFGPGLIVGVLLNLIWGAVFAWQTLTEGRAGDFGPKFFGWAGMLIISAYCFAGLQSIVYTAVMEWNFARGLDPESWRTVRLSTGLGFLSAMIPYGLILVDRVNWEWVALGAVLSGFGLAAGFLVGLLIKFWSAEKKNAGGSVP